METTLWHIAVSHYSEKARWALDWKGVDCARRTPLPGFHPPLALWLTRGRSVTLPILQLDGKVHGDSTAIIAALEERFPAPPLYPHDPEERRRALELEDWFDEEVAPYVRRVAFYELRRDPKRMTEFASYGAPVVARFGPTVVPYARAFTALRYRAADPQRAEEARRRVVAGFDRLEQELDGRDYLVGDRFTVADLTAAALLYPVVLPPEAPASLKHPPEPYERFRETLRGRAGFRWVAETFRRHRHAPVEAAHAAAR